MNANDETLREADFPTHGTTAEQLAFSARWAVLAPSSHNSQPWLFVINGNRLDLKADRRRTLPVVDPDNRELIISCGAALFYLRVALRHFGLSPSIELQPDCFDSDVLAVVRVTQRHERTPDDEQLFRAITHRHTNRTPFSDREPPASLIHELTAAALEHGSWLYLANGRAKEELAAAISEGDRLQAADPDFRREMATWMHPNDSHHTDGMPASTQGFSDLTSHVAPLLLRTFDLGSGRGARDRELAIGSPLLAVLGSGGDLEVDWVNSGQALAHVLLRATAAGVSASFLNQAIEVPALRQRVCEVIGRSGRPQLILRMGYGAAVSATPRRPSSDVVRIVP